MKATVSKPLRSKNFMQTARKYEEMKKETIKAEISQIK